MVSTLLIEKLELSFCKMYKCLTLAHLFRGESCLKALEELRHQLQIKARKCTDMGVEAGQVSRANEFRRRRRCSAFCRYSSFGSVDEAVGSKKTLAGIV